ncbi:MAG: glutaredoxin family protein [Verrucomicrobiae bacterium]|nr:glutaredoxin family protein [Verrucomicrobiae bacterium]
MSEETPTPKLRVYLKPGCPWCVDAVAWLKREGYDFDAIDVIADDAAFEEMYRISGQTKAPTMTYGDLLLADFGVPELEEFLEEHEIHP